MRSKLEADNSTRPSNEGEKKTRMDLHPPSPKYIVMSGV